MLGGDGKSIREATREYNFFDIGRQLIVTSYQHPEMDIQSKFTRTKIDKHTQCDKQNLMELEGVDFE